MTVRFLFLAYLLALLGCSREAATNASPTQNQTVQSTISEEQAISIAKQDALRAHLSPESYNPFAVEEGDVWHVIFEPKDEKDNLEPEYKILRDGRLAGSIYEKGSRSLSRNRTDQSGIGGERAIAIATADASKVVRLEECDASVFDEREFWHVAFALKNKKLNGGCPDYLIEKKTAQIVSRKFYQ